MPTEFIHRLSHIERVFNNGHAAYKNGEPIENNPHFEEEHHDAWEKGWYQGRWEDENE